jgi:hypothetical protein
MTRKVNGIPFRHVHVLPRHSIELDTHPVVVIFASRHGSERQELLGNDPALMLDRLCALLVIIHLMV